MPERIARFIVRRADFPAGTVPTVRSGWSAADWLGAAAVRLGIGRSRYRVEPGLYAVGSPAAESPVFVSANYKLSFDHLRRTLAGIDSWILVLDTRGINVWCAAGKGSFGTAEVAKRVKASRLERFVTHRTLILPQLAAPGVAAHAVTAKTGFRVQYGPVRARDIPAWLEAGRVKTLAMRTVSFRLADRLVLIPLEIVQALPLMALAAAAGSALEWLELRRIGPDLVRGSLPFVAASLAGSAGVPLLLPALPGKSFAFKGALTGLAAGIGLWVLMGWTPLKGAAILLGMAAVAAWEGLAFTGSSTFTNLQGVRKDMRFGLPPAIAAAAVSIGLRIFGVLALGRPA